MPPLKEYIFTHILYQNIEIKIEAYKETQALYKLEQIVKNVEDFKLN